MNKKDFLKELKGRIVGVDFIPSSISPQYFILLDYNSEFIEIENYMGGTCIASRRIIASISKTDKEGIKKFKGYQKRYRKDKSFTGDLQMEEENKMFG